MAHKTSKIVLFDYLDYRAFLKDWFSQNKSTRASMSYRTFSKKAGLKSTNFIMLVIQNKRNLTEGSLAKVIHGLALNKQEGEFFRHLVFFNQAKSHDHKNHYYQKLVQSKKYNQLKPMEKYQYEYCSAWYHAVIRELIASKDFDGSRKWISHRLFPKVSLGQIKKSLNTLEELGFIKKTKDDQWVQVNSLVSTGAEVESLALFNYHLNMLDLTKQVLPKVGSKNRDVSSMTLGITRERVTELKNKIQSFRKEILEMVASESHPQEVFQLNIHFFPLTQIEDDTIHE